MIPAALSLLLSRRALAAGVGMTTREDKVLPAGEELPEIPARSGVGKPIVKRIQSVLRGWYAHVVGAMRSARFTHNTLAVLDAGAETFGNTYSVLPFATPYNVPAGDTTKLNDVLSFLDGTVLVNGIPMQLLAISGAAPSGALPWLIPHGEPVGELGKYGDSVTNATVKRVFAIGRASVHSWANSGVDAALGGAAYRPEKALACGARIDTSAHAAWLAQIAYTGASWDALTGGWLFSSAYVAMLLTPPYLTKVDASFNPEQATCVPAALASTNETTHTPYTFPEAELCAIGIGELGSSNYTNGVYSQYRKVNFPTRDVFKAPFQGTYDLAKESSNYAGLVTASVSVGQLSASISETCSLIRSTNNETYSFPAQTISIGPSNGAGVLVSDTGDFYPPSTTVWNYEASGSKADKVPRFNTGGVGGYYHGSGNVGGWSAFTSSVASGTASIEIAGRRVVDVVFSRTKESGLMRVPAAVTGRYASALANPYAHIGETSGFGVAQQITVSLYNSDPLSCVGMRQPRIETRATDYVGGLCYSSWSADYGSTLYTSTSVARPTKDDRSLSWQTSDFVLFDEANQVYISIEAVFSGAQSASGAATASLDVVLKIATPSGSISQTLHHADLTYSDLLPEVELLPGVNYVPAPKLRVMFAPLYQEQGDFKGAAYTTAAEVSAGAVPTYLFNFVLKLDTYAAIGADTSSSPVVHCIPCNLIEMLYAYVFSQDYGVKATERYPVTFAARFNEFQNTLFSNQWRINYRNGALVDWLDALGGAYITEQTTELYRA